MKNNYDRIADLYDLYVTTDYDIAFWRRECASAGDVLEITAGTGRVTLPLLEDGLRITAVDVSYGQLERLRAKAQEHGLSVETVHADMREFDLGRTFPLVIIPFQSLQENIDTCDTTATLRRVRAHLSDDGRAIITLHHPEKQKSMDGSALRLVEEYELKNGNRMLFWRCRRYDEATHTGTSHQFYEEYDVDGMLRRKRVFSVNYHVYERAEIEQLIDQAGLRVTRAWGGYDWSELTGDSCFMIFELQKA